jgi:hypothetical protein
LMQMSLMQMPLMNVFPYRSDWGFGKSCDGRYSGTAPCRGSFAQGV